MKNVFLTLVALFSSLSLFGQLALAPTAIYLDKNGIGNLYITNNSDVAQEININFQFGYSSQDSNGVLIMVYDDSANAKLFSLEPMIKAFPRSFNLPPKQQQIVRIQARVPKGTPAGTYFTRVKVGSSGQVADVGDPGSAEGAISTRVNLRFEQVIVAFYKHGDVTTGVQIDKVNARVDSNLFVFDAYYKTSGNSPYLGRMKVIVKAADGTQLAEFNQSTALYFTGKRRHSFYLKEVPKGNVTMEMYFETNRADIPSEDLVQAKPYVYKTTVRLN